MKDARMYVMWRFVTGDDSDLLALKRSQQEYASESGYTMDQLIIRGFDVSYLATVPHEYW
jgi:hypothetical protein